MMTVFQKLPKKIIDNFNSSRVTLTSYPAVFILLLLLVMGAGCKKNHVKLKWEEQLSPTTDLLTQVHFTDENNGHIVGGDSWYYGLYLHTTDGGENWLLDTMGGKLLYSLHFQEDNAYAIGISGSFHIRPGENKDWRTGRQQGWDIWRDIYFFDENNGLIVGGEAFQNGLIARLDHLNRIVQVDSFQQEISAVCFSEKQTAHAVGYGAVLRSTDAGLTWNYQDVKDDFYKDIYFPTTETGYAVGAVGNIIKTTNKGETWTTIRNGNKVAVPDKSFRTVFFKDEFKGYIAGDNGVFWITENGGNDWKVVADLPDIDFYDVIAISDGGYLVGTEGRIIRFWE